MLANDHVLMLSSQHFDLAKLAKLVMYEFQGGTFAVAILVLDVGLDLPLKVISGGKGRVCSLTGMHLVPCTTNRALSWSTTTTLT